MIKERALYLMLTRDIVGEINDSLADLPKQQASPTMNSLWQLLGLLLVMAFVLIATYYTTRFIGGMKQSQFKNSNFEVIDTYRISQNKLLQIIKIGNKVMLIAISKDTVTFISELEESEITRRDESYDVKQSFRHILERFTNKKE